MGQGILQHGVEEGLTPLFFQGNVGLVIFLGGAAVQSAAVQGTYRARMEGHSTWGAGDSPPRWEDTGRVDARPLPRGALRLSECDRFFESSPYNNADYTGALRKARADPQRE